MTQDAATKPVAHRKPKTTTRQFRRSLLEVIAPPAPPCFLNRAQWIDFLSAADESAAADRVTPVVIFDASSGRASLNPKTQFCEDCTKDFRDAHVSAATCRPDWLVGKL